MRRRNFLRLGSGAALGGALAACNTDEDHRIAAPPPALRANTVQVWNEAALQAIEASRAGPLAAARVLAILHTSMYNAWAAYDDNARQTPHGVAVRLPRAERGGASKASAMSHAARLALAEELPSWHAIFDACILRLGVDPAAAAGAGPFTPAGIGRSQAASMLELCRQDGAAQAHAHAQAPDGACPASGPWCLQAQSVAALGRRGDDQDVRLFFVLSHAMAGLALSGAGAGARAITAPHLLRGAAGPGLAGLQMDGQEALRAAGAAAAAEVIRRVTGSDAPEACASARAADAGSAAAHPQAAAFGREAGARAFDAARRYWIG